MVKVCLSVYFHQGHSSFASCVLENKVGAHSVGAIWNDSSHFADLYPPCLRKDKLIVLINYAVVCICKDPRIGYDGPGSHFWARARKVKDNMHEKHVRSKLLFGSAFELVCARRLSACL